MQLSFGERKATGTRSVDPGIQRSVAGDDVTIPISADEKMKRPGIRMRFWMEKWDWSRASFAVIQARP